MKRNILAFVTALMLGNLTVAAQTRTVLGWGGAALPAGQPGTEFTKIAAGAGNGLALKSDGTVVAWGDNTSGESTVPPDLNGVVTIATGGDNSLALRMRWHGRGVGKQQFWRKRRAFRFERRGCHCSGWNGKGTSVWH